ncbi:lantibiotic dehydratase [Spirosoma linguale]|uniref:Lantibiotic dehydratase domain protein n=1 Tax=Spirosoma linguale (strain ATCC 33905 / DSM 74 / LMG 10896 / Claus 1) TaxID=504472 RepID=D2QPM3_SPILD|nr:Lantibiotic dehydratase domain protein [Spirosoma linguale DSM 74]
MQDNVLPKGILRTPMFSYRFYERILDGSLSLNELLNNPIFSNALYLASPELHAYSHQLLANPLADPRRYNKLKNTVLKYAYRAATRCTPFGLFSGLGVIDFTHNPTRLIMSEPDRHRTHVRLDMDFLGRLSQQLTTRPYIRPYLTYRTNTSLYCLGNSYRYINYQYVDGLRKFDLTAVEVTPTLETIIATAGTGAPFDVIAQSIVDEDVSYADAAEFISDLIDQRMLGSELEPSTTGQEAGHQLLETLMALSKRVTDPDHRQLLASLILEVGDLVQLVGGLNQVSTHRVEAYQTIIDKARQLCPDTNEKYLIQCDTVMQFEEHANLSADLLVNVQEGLDAFRQLSVPARPNPQMQQFIKRFAERYGDQEVPLTEALDVEMGVGYGAMADAQADFAGFIDRLPLEQPQAKGLTVEWDNRLHNLLAQKILAAYQTGSDVISLSEKDIHQLTSATKNQAPYNTYSCGFSLFKDDAGQPVVLINGYGNHTGAALIGRFCHTDPQIHALAQHITDTETALNPDALVAEVNHLPQDRLGNVMQRPILRPYEIPFLANSFLDADHQLAVADLLVSVQSDKVVLRSKQHGKVVLPYLTNALVHEKESLPIFHFLGDLQLEDNGFQAVVNMGILPQVFPYIPRIQYKNVILKRAAWILQETDIEKISKVSGDAGLDQFTAIADALGLPEQFVLAHFDNQLPICRTNPDSVQLFIDEIRGHKKVVLLESLLSRYDSFVHTADGEPLNNELMAFFSNGDKARQQKSKIGWPSMARLGTKRDFLPGSEWVYFKVYTGFNVSDKFIATLESTVAPLLTADLVEKWFFIRYNDPEPHIRLRLKLADPSTISQVLARLNQTLEGLKQDGRAWKIVIDTYSRELERYGETSIDAAETVFFADSLAASRIVRAVPDEWRWLAGMASVDAYLTSFGFSQSQKLSLVTRMKDGFELEFKAGKEARKHLNSVYSAHKELIAYLMDPECSERSVPLIQQINRINAYRQEQQQTAIDQIQRSATDERQLESRLISLIHMSINRLFRSRQRLFEYSFYHFLKNYYTSRSFINPVLNSSKPELV